VSLRASLHLALHLAVPGAVAWLAFRPRWQRAWLLMLLGWLIDLDHLLADPVYDPDRCSIGYHPLHTAPAAAGFALLLIPRPTRLVGLGIAIHLGLDALDCVLMRAA
jgi:hypothetical protein